MLNKNRARKSFLFAALSLLPALISPVASGQVDLLDVRAAGETRSNPSWITPPAPVIDDEMRLAELKARRDRVAEQIGPNGMLVLFSAEPKVYTNDVDYEFRQENNLYYLTNLRQKGATLVMLPGHKRHREILFLPRRNQLAETWTGHMYSAAEAANVSGIAEVWDAREFEPFLAAVKRRTAYRPTTDNVLLTKGEEATAASGYEELFNAAPDRAAIYLLLPRDEDSREYRQEQRFAAQFSQTASPFPLRNAWPIFVALRQRKSPLEIRLMQHAVDITIEGFRRSMAAARESRWEYEIEAEVDYVFKKRHADNWGYPSIVGCGANATTLHYVESESPVRSGELLLMDVGAEYEHYTADVTRTYPINGAFSAAQSDIYNLVLAAQEAGFARVRPGAMFQDAHLAAVETIKDGLLRLGLITDRNSNQYRYWFMHGTSHFLGMNVHDVGLPGKLEPGMVFTVEPGIYIRPDTLDNLPKTPENEKFIAAVRPAFEKYKSIGVRIEDDILVTPEGYRNLSAALPRTIPDVEKAMGEKLR